MKKDETNENKERWAQNYQACSFDIAALFACSLYNLC